jgi:hypothetical protein
MPRLRISAAIPLLLLYDFVDSGHEDGTDRWYWNLGRKLPLYAAQHPRRVKFLFTLHSSSTVDATYVDVDRVANWAPGHVAIRRIQLAWQHIVAPCGRNISVCEARFSAQQYRTDCCTLHTQYTEPDRLQAHNDIYSNIKSHTFTCLHGSVYSGIGRLGCDYTASQPRPPIPEITHRYEIYVPEQVNLH